MSRRRIKLEGTAAVYHCMSRIVSGDMRMERKEKEVLRKMLRQVADFSGVEILAYCLMTNHFHILVRVPKKDPLTREEVLRRYRVLYAKSNSPQYPDAVGMQAILEGDDEELAAHWMERLQARMGDVTEFIKTLKQRFSIWYNKTHEHFGAVWAEPFKSVLVENHPDTLKTVAAYLDLNPVRAKLVEDPAEYRWCSYAEAMGGDAICGKGLAAVMGASSWKEAVADYRVVLFGKGGTARRVEQGTIPRERVEQVLRKGGRVEMCELLRCRVRYFSDGAIVGSEAFVRTTGSIFTSRIGKERADADQPDTQANPPTSSAKRLGKLRLMGGLTLTSWRDLQDSAVVESSETESGPD